MFCTAPPEFMKAIFELHYDVRCTLEELEKVRANLSQELSHSKFIFFLYDLKTNPMIVIICLIPSECVSPLKDHARQLSLLVDYQAVGSKVVGID